MSLNETPEFSFAGYDFIFGHYPYSFYEDRLPLNTTIVTLLRDPVARVLSQYAYDSEFGYWPDETYTEAVKGMMLEEWLEYEPAGKRWQNVMTRYLCDGIMADISTAMEHLNRIDVVGFLDEFDGLQVAANKLCEVERITAPTVVGRYNMANYPVRLSDLKPALLGQIQRENALDIILYNYAKELA